MNPQSLSGQSHAECLLFRCSLHIQLATLARDITGLPMGVSMFKLRWKLANVRKFCAIALRVARSNCPIRIDETKCRPFASFAEGPALGCNPFSGQRFT
jgi:hypothetical protein